MLGCALVVGAAPSVTAQCLGPDGLDVGPCCAPVTPTLPPFPGASLPGLGICWTQCSVNATRPLKVSWTTPSQPFCSEYSTQLTVADGASGLPILAGKLTLDYTRTWTEVDTSGVAWQIWRFTAKADVAAVPGVAPLPCPVPSCIAPLGPHPTAFFYGYADYKTCAAAGPWDNVLVLYHAADRFIHAPGLSSMPGVFHPTASYAIVAPNSAVQPFIPANIQAFGGPLIAEATRAAHIPGALICAVEDRLVGGSIVKLGAGCINTLSTVPKQQTLRQVTGTTTCINTAGVPGGFASLNVSFPTLPWMHMVTTSIGSWGNPNVYPGNEIAWVDEGLFVHQDACFGDFIELKYGGSTRGGWAAILPSGIPSANFTDIVDNFTAPITGPFTGPVLGNVMPSDHLVYVNEP